MYTTEQIDYLCELYLQAYEASDLDKLEQLWEMSAQSPMLDQAFREINDGVRAGE